MQSRFSRVKNGIICFLGGFLVVRDCWELMKDGEGAGGVIIYPFLNTNRFRLPCSPSWIREMIDNKFLFDHIHIEPSSSRFSTDE